MKQTTVPEGEADPAKGRGRVSRAVLREPPLSVVHARALLQGLKLSAGGDWTPAATTQAGDGLVSEVLGLEVLLKNGELRFREPGSDDVLPDAVESAKLVEELAAQAGRETTRADRETARADGEAARADAVQRRIAELEDRLRHAEGR